MNNHQDPASPQHSATASKNSGDTASIDSIKTDAKSIAASSAQAANLQMQDILNNSVTMLQQAMQSTKHASPTANQHTDSHQKANNYQSEAQQELRELEVLPGLTWERFQKNSRPKTNYQTESLNTLQTFSSENSQISPANNATQKDNTLNNELLDSILDKLKSN